MKQAINPRLRFVVPPFDPGLFLLHHRRPHIGAGLSHAVRSRAEAPWTRFLVFHHFLHAFHFAVAVKERPIVEFRDRRVRLHTPAVEGEGMIPEPASDSRG